MDSENLLRPQAETVPLNFSEPPQQPLSRARKRGLVSRPNRDRGELRHIALSRKFTRTVTEIERVVAYTRALGLSFDAEHVRRIVVPVVTLKWLFIGLDPAPRVSAWCRAHLPDARHDDELPAPITEFDRDALAHALRISPETILVCFTRHLVSTEDTTEARRARKRESDRVGAKARRLRKPGAKTREACTTRRDELALGEALGCNPRSVRRWKADGVPASALRRWRGEGNADAKIRIAQEAGLRFQEMTQTRRQA